MAPIKFAYWDIRGVSKLFVQKLICFKVVNHFIRVTRHSFIWFDYVIILHKMDCKIKSNFILCKHETVFMILLGIERAEVYGNFVITRLWLT